MTEYKLVNPSDPYTFFATDREVAALTVFLVSTAYGANPKTGDEGVPLFIFGGAEEWYQTTFGRSPDEGMDARRKEVAGALCSMMYGNFEDRRRYEAALEAITEEERRQKFIADWQDGHGSLDDIGNYCHELGRKLLCSVRKNENEEEREE